MLLVIHNVLNGQELEKTREFLAKAKFVDGKLTAGVDATKIKNNLELANDNPQVSQLNNMVMNAVLTKPEFRSSVLPARVATPIFSSYSSGMSYGDHVDNPVMGGGDVQYRSDVSLTLFINEPDQYEGGELVINSTFGEQSVKLAAGDMVVYPSSSIHHVNPVTEGCRLVMITFIQSLVRDPAKREILYNLSKAHGAIKQESALKDEAGLVDISYVNLVRMWAEL